MSSSPGVYPLLRNLRSYAKNILQTRPGTVRIAGAGAGPAHSLKRLNDSVPGATLAWTRVVGSGTELRSGQTSFALKASGFSGDPLALVDYRPIQSPESWVYIGDSAKTGKINVGGTFYNMGIAPPLSAPTSSYGIPAQQVIDAFSAMTPGVWVASGTASALTESETDRINTTIREIVYDSGTTGWASILLTADVSALGPGALIRFNDGGGTAETVEVNGVWPSLSSTTISAIIYLTGPPGVCWIQALSFPGSPVVYTTDKTAVYYQNGLNQNTGALFTLDSGGPNEETISIAYVVTNPDGSGSFTCTTTKTHVVGETITSTVPTIRCYLANTHAIGETVKAGDFSYSVATGIGLLSETAGFDLTQVNGRPIQPTDEFHLSILISDSTQLVEGRVMFDVDATINDFTQNYYYQAFRQSDLASAANQLQTQLTATQQAIQNAQVDSATLLQVEALSGMTAAQLAVLPHSGFNPAPASSTTTSAPTPSGGSISSDQIGSGKLQWLEFYFTVASLLQNRVGSDTSRDLTNVGAVGISLNVAGPITVKVAALTVSGTYGPDIGSLGSQYIYRYRYRSLKAGGARSQLSPPQRNGLQPHNQQITVSVLASADPQVDTIDIYRYGGALSNWRYVGTTPNADTTFYDDYQDADIANNDLAEFDDYRPFPTVDIPRSGTCNVVGAAVNWVSGDAFNVLWAPGSIMTIDGIDYTLYNYPASTTYLEIVESAGAQTDVPFQLRQPLLDAQPLPCLWGPFLNLLLACGDLYQPGTLFMTKGNNPDSAPDSYEIEVSTPSEPLMNGCMFGGFSYVYSSERAFSLTQDYTGQNVMLATQIPNSLGIYSRWGLAVGNFIYGLWRTGIWKSDGGAQRMITDPDLTLLFPHDGQPGQPVTLGSVTFQPPDFTQPTFLRLSYADSHLKFNYLDVNGIPTTLVYNEIFNRWGPDIYTFNGSAGASCHYQEEAPNLHSNLIGGSDGVVYQESGTTDNGHAFTGILRMPQVGGPSGFEHTRDGYVGLLSNAVTSLVVNVEGTDYTTSVPSTAGAYEKEYVVLPALKGKTLEWGVSSTSAWKLWIGDTFFRVKAWAEQQYDKFQPFSNLKREM